MDLTPDQVRQKRIELFANYLDIVAAGCAIGAIVTAPLAEIGKGDRTLYATLVVYQTGTFVLSLCLHFIAQRVLGRLSP